MPSTRRRFALLNQCSGKDRLTWAERTPLIGAAALAAGMVPHREVPETKARCPTRRGNGTAQIGSAAHGSLTALELRAAWKRGALGHEMPVADGWCTNRTVMCMVSVCAMINATHADRERVEHVSMVDEDTPRHLLDMLERLGVRIVDLSNATFPRYFNNASAAIGSAIGHAHGAAGRTARSVAPAPSLPPGATVAQALAAGHSHYSYVPNCWAKLWVWNLTEYEKVLWYDPDVLAVGNAYRDVLVPTPAFGVVAYPKSKYLNTGVMVIEPREQIFRELYRLWHTGDYPYVHGRTGGDDDQHFFQNIIYGHRVSGLRLHALSPCHNDKSGRAKGCKPELAVLHHKTPLWEAARERALWKAARDGKCAGNPELLNWQYPQTPIEAEAGAWS